MANLEFLSNHTAQEVDLEPIHQAILAEPKSLLPRSLESLQRKYHQGMAVVMLVDQAPAGYVEFSPLVDQHLKSELDLEGKIPEIWEIGGAIILNYPELRGQGYYPQLRNALLERYQDRIQGQELLVLGTTKRRQVVQALKAAQGIGINFHLCHHLEFPMIAGLTCSCAGEFGQGLQIGSDCPARVDKSFIPLSSLYRNLPQQADGQMPCVMYVSDQQLASATDQTLLARFGSQTQLIGELSRLNYYNS